MSTAFRSPSESVEADPPRRRPAVVAILAENLRLVMSFAERRRRGLARWLRSLSRRFAPVGARVERWSRPARELVSGLGWWTLATAVVTLVAALWLGWAELLAISLVGFVCLLLAIGWVLGRLHYDVQISLASLRVVVGERAVGEVRVRNVGTRSAAPSMIELPVGRALASVPIPRLGPDAEHEELFTIPTQRRAVLQLGPVRSVRQDPLQLLRRRLNWTEPEEIYVHPRTVRLENSSTGFVRDLEGLPTRDLSNDDVSFHALREYQPGDDLRYVHWRSTARTGKLMIRQFEETRRSQFVIVVSTRLDEYADDDEFELGISIAASLARSAQLEGKEVSVFTSDQPLSTRTPDRLMDGFSAIEPSLSTTSYPDRVRSIAADNPGASVVGLVTGSGLQVADVHLASLRTPLMARCFAVRAAFAEPLGRRELGDLVIATVPSLDDLRLAMRAVS
jgi:uncharacterized protein (DUF58 family)